MEENPIDKDKVAENPGLLPYAHHVGSAVIKPIDKGRLKGLAVSAMYEQTDMQMEQIRKQIELLAQQAQKIQRRVEISEKIYRADCSFRPLISHTYHLYRKHDDTLILAMIGHDEWGKRGMPYNEFIASVQLLADHTWKVLIDGQDENSVL